MDAVTRALVGASQVIVKQRFELGEAFGFETRNKYSVQDAAGQVIAYAAEPSAGLMDLVLRMGMGHWRRYDIFLYTPQREKVAIIHHPFAFFFQRLEVKSIDGRPLGALQQRFTFFRKRFTVEGPDGRELMSMEAPLLSMWTFPFFKGSQEVAKVEKKWGGSLVEVLTDKDTFRLSYADPSLSADERVVLLAAALFVDMQYFEAKAN